MKNLSSEAAQRLALKMGGRLEVDGRAYNAGRAAHAAPVKAKAPPPAPAPAPVPPPPPPAAPPAPDAEALALVREIAQQATDTNLAMLQRLEALIVAMAKPKAWTFQVQRDRNDRLTGLKATAST